MLRRPPEFAPPWSVALFSIGDPRPVCANMLTNSLLMWLHGNMKARGGAIAVLCAFSLLTGISVAAGVFLVRDPSYSCLVDVLPSVSASVDVAFPISGEISTFPIGLQCSYTSTTGIRTIVHPDGWLTALAGVSVVSLLGACVLGALGFRRQGPSPDK